MIGRNKSLLRPLMLRSLVLWAVMPWGLILRSLMPWGMISWSLVLVQRSCTKFCLYRHLFLDLCSLSLEEGALGSDMPT